MLRASVSLVLALGAASCGTQAAMLNMTTWNEGAFSISLPAEMSKVDDQGDDSQCAIFATADRAVEVSYDFGWYSSDLSSELDSFETYRSEAAVIDGEDAVVVVGTLKPDARWRHEGRRVVAATWQHIGGAESQAKLTVLCQLKDARLESAMLDVIRGVRFHSK